MNKYKVFPFLIVVISILIFIKVASELSSVVLFIPAVIVTYIVYLNTFYRHTPKPDRILPLYLLLLGVQFLHFTEEYLTNFHVEVPKLLGQEAYSLNFWITFNMIAYSIFIIGGIIIFKRLKEYMIIPLFFIITGVILNSIGHILISIYVQGYFSGLYTSFIYIIVGPILIKRLVEVTRYKRQKYE